MSATTTPAARADGAASLPLGIADIEAAALRLAGVAVRTPLLESEALSERAGVRLLLKAEPLQRTGSFKLRGAYNAIAATRPRAVVAYSSGNHAQGVALAARLLGVHATIVMPADAPRVKLDNTRALGARVVTYDRLRESRERIGDAIAAETGAVLVKPYDDPLVMAGQGTLGLEIAEQAEAAGVRLGAAVVCCGGGGLVAGCATALRARSPGTAVLAAEPAGYDDTRLSLEAGERVGHGATAPTICDAIMTPIPGELTFLVNSRLLAGGLAASDDEVREAMRLAFRHLRLVVEPGGAVALAAALAHGRRLPGAEDGEAAVAVVLSGGNVDPDLFADVLRRG